MNIAEFFDENYRSEERYWWRESVRYSGDPADYPHSLLTQMTLRLIADCPPGRALDLGAGEGTDSIRLALMGYDVDAVEISKVGAEKIKWFAAEARADVNVINADIELYEPNGIFDVVICNGALHYIEDKRSVISAMQEATRIGGINVISLWSTFTAVPECHEQVPIFCDDEDGITSRLYRHWTNEFIYHDRAKSESSHSDMPPHSHSHIKLIARKAASVRDRSVLAGVRGRDDGNNKTRHLVEICSGLIAASDQPGDTRL
jgi:tellurite methyltransferase